MTDALLYQALNALVREFTSGAVCDQSHHGIKEKP